MTAKREMKGNIEELKGKLKQRFAILKNDELMYQEGQEEEFYGHLQKKLGKSRRQIRKIISDLER